MLKLYGQVDEAHARALAKLIDSLDYEAIRSYADSDQEAYDMVFGLNCIRQSLKEAQD